MTEEQVEAANNNFKVRSHMMFVLADVIDTFVGECEKYMPEGIQMNKQVKESLKKLKARTEKTVQFVDKVISFENAIEFGNDADYMHKFILTLVDRVGDSHELETKALSMITNMKSQFNLEIA